MCQYYHSLYLCGHQRLEVTECPPIARIPGARRCTKPRHVPSVTQPCGCLDAFLLARLHAKTRLLPVHMSNLRAQPYQLMNQIWSVRDATQLSSEQKKSVLVDAGLMVKGMERDEHCISAVPKGERLSEEALNKARWQEEADEIAERETMELENAEAERERGAFDQATGRDARVRGRRDSFTGVGGPPGLKRRRSSEREGDVRKRPRAGEVEAKEKGRLTPVFAATPEWMKEGWGWP